MLFVMGMNSNGAVALRGNNYSGIRKPSNYLEKLWAIIPQEIPEYKFESYNALSSQMPDREASRAFCGPKSFIADNFLISRSIHGLKLEFLCVG
jgi:hypothetical protein